jgi:hypothetical protein
MEEEKRLFSEQEESMREFLKVFSFHQSLEEHAISVVAQSSHNDIYGWELIVTSLVPTQTKVKSKSSSAV